MRCLLAAIRCEKGDVPGNLASHLRLLADAASAGCQLAVFPEMSLTGSAEPAASPERLITLDHPAVARLAGAAGDAAVGVCFGIAERAPDGRPHITQVFAAAGRVVGVQRKRHLGEGEEASAPASPRWSVPTAASQPGCPTGTQECSPLTSPRARVMRGGWMGRLGVAAFA